VTASIAPALFPVRRLCGHVEQAPYGGRFGSAWLATGARTVLCAACQVLAHPDALRLLALQCPRRCACGATPAPDLAAFAALEGIPPQDVPEDQDAPAEAWDLDPLHPEHPAAYALISRHCVCGSTFSLKLIFRRGAR
jgi:hypothetical protein